ncbi:Annexin A5, partial [Galemys pyrenaicus]
METLMLDIMKLRLNKMLKLSFKLRSLSGRQMKKSVSQLRRVFDKHMTVSGFQTEEGIDHEASSNLKQLLLAIVKSIEVYLPTLQKQ